MNKKIIFLLIVSITILQACKFRSLLKYYHPDKTTHLPNFNKWDNFVGSNTNPIRACYDVTCYDWSVAVYPESEKIRSTMKIYFKMEFDQDTILLDFQSNFKIDEIKSASSIKKFKRKKNSLFIIFEKELHKGEKGMVEITYHGTPVKLIGNTTLTWQKDSLNFPWICTSTEGLGPHQLIPCKNLLYDESDSCFIRVNVPKGLMAVANGKLDSITESNNRITYNWSVKNPINIYNISFNVGKYVKLEKAYKDINNVDRKIEIYALDYNKEKADKYYDQAPIIMAALEKLYGIYPWWSDGCKFIESCLKDGDCMEHQSAISMAENYRLDFKKFSITLVHELAHEWWGNNITGFDYADIWLHEGFATYSEALFIEENSGKNEMDFILYYKLRNVVNKRPILKTRNVAYKPWIQSSDADIYDKAGWFIHTLRIAINDDTLFFDILKTAQQKFSKSNITTDQFLAFINEKTSRDFTPYFDIYLKNSVPPILEYRISNVDTDSTILEYKWRDNLPKGGEIPLIMMSNNIYYTLKPTTEYQVIKFSKNDKYYFEMTKSGYYYLKDITERKK